MNFIFEAYMQHEQGVMMRTTERKLGVFIIIGENARTQYESSSSSSIRITSFYFLIFGF